METKVTHNFSVVPHNYPLCLNRQCPKASTCLRQLVEQEVTEQSKFLVIINPQYQSAIKGDCPDYRCSTKVQFAKGLMSVMENITAKQMQKVVHDLINIFSQRTYYRIRKGERLLSPAEQVAVREIFKKYGVVERIEFDRYVEDYEW